MKKIALLVLAALVASTTQAGLLEDELVGYEGYQIDSVKTIIGWHDTTGTRRRGDMFEGCMPGRVIIFEGNVSLKCNTVWVYIYVRPSAVILSNGALVAMIVEGHIYPMTR